MIKNKKTKDLDKTEEFTGLIFPYLNHLYKLFLLPIIKKYNLYVDKEFWIFLSLAIFSWILYFTGIRIHLPIILSIGTIVVLILHNNRFFRRKIFPKQSELIEEFLSDLNNSNIHEVVEFIKGYSLDTDQIIAILKGKFGKNYTIYDSIHRYQDVTIELIEYIELKDLTKFMGTNLFSNYLLSSYKHLSLNTYFSLKKKFKENPKIIKVLNLSNPNYLLGHSLFKFFVNNYLNIRETLRNRFIRIVLLLISLTFVSYVFDRLSIISLLSFGEGTYAEFLMFSFVFLISSLLAIYILSDKNILIWSYKNLLYFFAPKN